MSSSSSTSTNDRPLRADARRNRARVLEEARKAFAEFGSELPIDEVARRAGVGVGTLYRHFPNKEALLDALLADQLTKIIEITRDAADRPDAWEAWQQMVRDGAAMQAEDVSLCEVVMAHKAQSVSPTVARLRDELETETAKLIARAQAEGKMRADFTPADVGLLFASVAGAVRASGSEDGWRRHVEFALAGLRA